MLTNYCYDNNGLGYRYVALDYVAQTGEMLFPDEATEAQLTAAFPGYVGADAAQTLLDQAQGLLNGGITLTCTSLSALDATYPLDNATIQLMMGEFMAIMAGTETADSYWPDVTGAVHTFTPAQFQAFGPQCFAVVKAVRNVILGQSTTLPSASVTIP